MNYVRDIPKYGIESDILVSPNIWDIELGIDNEMNALLGEIKRKPKP